MEALFSLRGIPVLDIAGPVEPIPVFSPLALFGVIALVAALVALAVILIIRAKKKK